MLSARLAGFNLIGSTQPDQKGLNLPDRVSPPSEISPVVDNRPERCSDKPPPEPDQAVLHEIQQQCTS